MLLRETAKFQWGEAFERALSEYVKRKDWAVLPVYNYRGEEEKAPALERLAGDVILPDLHVMKGGVSPWIEAKRKTRADWTYITQRLETGIPLRHYKHYKLVKQLSGDPVLIVFGHDDENSVRWTEIDALAPRIYAGGKMSPGGMAFWPWDQLTEICRLSELLPLEGEKAA